MPGVLQVVSFKVTVPHGTAIATPQTTQLQLGTSQVSWVELQVPPGPRGALGLYIASSNVQVIPANTPSGPNWLVLDDDTDRYDQEGQTTGGDWQAVAYNIGAYDHTFWVRFAYAQPDQTSGSSGSGQFPSLGLLNA